MLRKIPDSAPLTERAFRAQMTLFVLAIFMCIAVMMASTLALFYDDVAAETTTIASAHYSITVDQTQTGTYRTPLAYEDTHTFIISAEGTATTGYCRITVGDEEYFTAPIPQDTSLTMTIQAARDTVITFSPCWGSPPTTFGLRDMTCGTEILHSQTPHAVYTVEPTARLSEIAEYYGVPESDITVYNIPADSASTVSLLTAGAELKIPGVPEDTAPYKVPFSVYTVEHTASLSAIADHYGVAEADIRAFNNDQFSVGMQLKIPYADPSVSAYAVPYAVYVVEPTAIPAHIASYYGVSLDTIYGFNGIDGITVGMSLKIPGVPDSYTPYSVPYAVYTVEPTATLADIAAHYGIAEWAICAFNGIQDITEGMTLRIPGVSSDAEPYVAPVPEPPVTEEKETADQKTENAAQNGTVEDKSDDVPAEVPAEVPVDDESQAEEPATSVTDTPVSDDSTDAEEQPSEQEQSPEQEQEAVEQPPVQSPEQIADPSSTVTPAAGNENETGDQPPQDPPPTGENDPTTTDPA